MKKFLVLLLMTALTVSLAGCSKPEETALTPTEENFEEDKEKEEPETSPEENASAETAEPVHDPAAAEELKNCAAAYTGVIRAMYQPDISKDGVSYVPSDREFFWLSVYFTAVEAGDLSEDILPDEKAGTLTIPASVIQEYAAAAFGSKQSLPEIPPEITYIKADGENYIVTVSDTGDTTAAITKAYKNSDGTYTAFIDFSTSEGLLGSYKITFQESTNEEALFKYQITDAVLVK